MVEVFFHTFLAVSFASKADISNTNESISAVLDTFVILKEESVKAFIAFLIAAFFATFRAFVTDVVLSVESIRAGINTVVLVKIGAFIAG
jgi:hypothetical protein